MTPQPGRLFLLPSPITENGVDMIPVQAVSILHGLEYFLVEKARTARRYISATRPPGPIDRLRITEMPEGDIPAREVQAHLQPLRDGKDMGILSEAGLPGIADPGRVYVAEAHRMGVAVIPVAGPSSIFMALMASGLEGQRFMFHGYLSAKKEELGRQLRDLEQRADRDDATQIFIEAPYRNQQVMATVEKLVSPHRLFCIAAGIGEEDGLVKTKRVGDWVKTGWPEIHKVPAVFLMR